MTASLITVQNAPRDYATIFGYGRAIKYRLALSMNLISGDDPEKEKAFTAASQEEQTQALLAGLQSIDAQQGHVSPSSPPPAATPAVTRTPATSAKTAAPGVLVPTPMAAAKPEASLARTPSTGGDPANKGTKPVTAPAGADSAQMLAVIGKVWDTMQAVGKSVEASKTLQNELAESFVQVVTQNTTLQDELSQCRADLASLKSIVDLTLGLVVEMAQGQMGLDRGSMVKMAAIAAEEALELIPKGTVEGK